MKKILKNIMYIIVILLCLTGCSSTSGEDDKKKDKTEEEISYVEDAIFNIANKYAKGEYDKDERKDEENEQDKDGEIDEEKERQIDWDSILKDEKRINDVLDTILLDLSDLEIDNHDLVTFSDALNQLIVVTAEQNESEMMTKLSNLYALLPKYMDKCSEDKKEVKKKEIKSLILTTYGLANSNHWDDAKITIQTAEDKYNEMMNDVDYMQDNSYNLNKIYILIEELKNTIQLENIELVKVKYISLIEDI